MMQNSHWLGYTLGGVSAAGLMYYLFTHETQTQANADGELLAASLAFNSDFLHVPFSALADIGMSNREGTLPGSVVWKMCLRVNHYLLWSGKCAFL